MRRNVIVPALQDVQRAELETLCNAKDCEFFGLLDVASLVEAEHIDFDELLARAREELYAYNNIIGVLAHWDFPTSVLVPLLNAELGIAAPSLESVLKCEHKYWSRLEQRRAIPEFVPEFSGVDPFVDDPFEQITLDFPFWLKPVKAFSSQLGFKINNREQFDAAIERIRAEIHHFGDAFDQALAHADLPDEIRRFGGNACIAEDMIRGRQLAPEGSLFQGEFTIHGTFDMPEDETGQMYDSLIYPSDAPESVQRRMADACERYFRHIGYDNGCFNVEFLWDEATDSLKVIEFNTRISQSHSGMFILVDGVSNHEVALDVALGRRPDMPRGNGRYRVAGKFIIPCYHDAVVTALPSRQALQTLEERFPGTEIRIDVEQGTRLSELPNQDEFFYHLGGIYLGADSRVELRERYQICLDSLDFQFQRVEEQEEVQEQAKGGAA